MLKAKLIGVTEPVIDDLETPGDLIAYCARVSNPSNQFNTDTADKLLAYLKKHKHWSPFEMVNAVVEVECPRDIARQVLRHRSFSFQEFSQRYSDVSALSSVFCIRELRMQDTENRQNSLVVDDKELETEWEKCQKEVLALVDKHYKWALGKGIAKEVARVLLPEGLTMSRMYVNGTIRSWIHYFEVRIDEGVTQAEHVTLARLIAQQVNQAFPISYEDTPCTI